MTANAIKDGKLHRYVRKTGKLQEVPTGLHDNKQNPTTNETGQTSE